MQEIQVILDSVEKCHQNVKYEDETRNELIKLRERMDEVRRKWILQNSQELQESQCPFCGNIWDSQVELEAGISALKNIIEKNQGEEKKKLDQELEKLQQIFKQKYQQPILSYIKNHNYLICDTCKELYDQWEEKRIQFILFKKECQRYLINLENWHLSREGIEEWNEKTTNFIDEVLKTKIVHVDDEYMERKQKYLWHVDYVSLVLFTIF